MKSIEEINSYINEIRNNNGSVKEISDGHHTFSDYVDMRNTLFVALCNSYPEISWKSKNHYDEENDPMFNDCFIAGINSKTGVITFHLKTKFWDDLNVQEIDRAPKYDNYTEKDVKMRIKNLKR